MGEKAPVFPRGVSPPTNQLDMVPHTSPLSQMPNINALKGRDFIETAV